MRRESIRMNENEVSGSIGIGAMIVFIALILVAAVASAVIIQTGEKLQQNAQQTGDDTREEIGGKVSIITVWVGDQSDCDADVAAQDNFVAQNTPSEDQYDDPLDNMKEKEKKPSQNYDHAGEDKNEGSSGSGGMMLVVILLLTLLGGVGFFLWQKSKSSSSKSENKDLDSTEASTDEPEQSSDL